jgi:long-chain acyl-CoA synthetase
MNRDQVTTLGAMFFWNVEQFDFQPLLEWESKGKRCAWSTRQFETDVLKLAKWMTGSGLETGDRIALYSDNRPEWHIVEFAAHLAQVVLVPVYPTLVAHQMQEILEHSGAKIAFCGPAQMERLQGVRQQLPELSRAVALDPEAGAENLPAILAALPPVTADEREGFRKQALAEDPHAMATIVYTSGTTGAPKGVMLSHDNFIFNATSSMKMVPDRAIRGALSVLPLSHVFERVMCYSYFLRGGKIAYGDPHDLKTLLTKYQPEVMGAVPRILEKMREAIEATIAKMPPHRRAISAFLLQVGYDRMQGKSSLRAKLHPVAEALMFRKVHAQLGNVDTFIVGGAWLNPELERYFAALGFHIIQGYGLTETSPVIACNKYGEEKPGSAGRPIPGIEVKIDEEGEILTRGPHVMKGYFRDPEATAKVMRDGWFVTGDLGHLEPDGFLVITGRRKEMLVLSNGKNIYYAPIEQALLACPYVEQAFVVGEGRNYTGLIIVPRIAALLQYAASRGIMKTSGEGVLLSAPVLELYREAIDQLQAGFSRFEQTKRFCFLGDEALLDTELVTPTLKVRRRVLERKYGPFIERLYAEDKPFVIPAAGH